METYALALSYAIPGFVVLVIIESIAARLIGRKVNNGMDTISSLSSGMTNTLKSLMGLSIVILSYDWMASNWAIFDIKSSLWLYILAFIGIDFASYWSHRFNHVVNVFWNRHIVHHSSEEFNLACALRQSISGIVEVYFFLYIPMAILGIPTEVVAIVAPLHLFAQFWYHTRLIGKMGFLEHIIVTPSHHRVHHAINKEYIDKNLAAIFIVWDKMFGTFQEELEDVPPVYGTLKPVKTWNPVVINFMHLWQLIKDAWRAESWWDKARIWFMPTGWRPDDVKKKYPVEIVTDVYNRPKYDSKASAALLTWSWFQLLFHLGLMYYALISFGNFDYMYIMAYMVFLFISIFAYTSLMDGHMMALFFEGLKMISGLGLIYLMDGWYGLNEVIAGTNLIIISYLIASFVATVYFLFLERKPRLQASV
ncbi:MAG: sterol desaturase family protein [Saprospiraceae bacterium]|nr:sterol desaturase family protein [Saprospiraceae bacterium]